MCPTGSLFTAIALFASPFQKTALFIPILSSLIQVSQAHQALKEASSTLCGLADYCEDNFKDGGSTGGQTIPSEGALELDPTGDIPGGSAALRQTADFAVRALQVGRIFLIFQ